MAGMQIRQYQRLEYGEREVRRVSFRAGLALCAVLHLDAIELVSLTIGDMRDKAAPEKLQGYWILELGELAGLKKVDVETVKAFITRQDDKFRHSYISFVLAGSASQAASKQS